MENMDVMGTFGNTCRWDGNPTNTPRWRVVTLLRLYVSILELIECRVYVLHSVTTDELDRKNWRIEWEYLHGL
jgi:hypothetical protein